jgi:hypothetical protein
VADERYFSKGHDKQPDYMEQASGPWIGESSGKAGAANPEPVGLAVQAGHSLNPRSGISKAQGKKPAQH